MRGGWAGELGQTQFLPSSYMKFAVDFDGDGRRDLIHSSADALASTANYLKGYGWKAGQPWGEGTANFGVLDRWNKAEVYRRTIVWFAKQIARRVTRPRLNGCRPLWQVGPAQAGEHGCRSSVVEHPLGKGEVHSSILCGSTSISKALGMSDDRHTAKPPKATARERREARLAEALRANLKRRKAAAKGGSPASASPPRRVAVQDRRQALIRAAARFLAAAPILR